MTSEELLIRRRQEDNNILLVDVRTEPERQTSMIPGAISLDKLPHELPPTVVTYCTIGYRSGLEARRLLDSQQSNPNWKGEIYSLDGILAYSHTPNTTLIVPATGETTHEVHAFGPMWKPCANPDYQAQVYGALPFLGRILQVVGLVLVRGTQHSYSVLSRCLVPHKHLATTTNASSHQPVTTSIS